MSFIYKIFRRILYGAIGFVRYQDGSLACSIRVFLHRQLAQSIGAKVIIGPAVYIQDIEKLRLGNNVSIHQFCLLSCEGGLEIGNDVSIAHNCSILTTSHIYDQNDLPIKDSGVHYQRTYIGHNVWLGCGTRILAGSTVSDSVVVGANSVVKGILPPNSVCVGSPAVVKKQRAERAKE